MTALDRVRDLLIGRSPEPLCDDCIADHLKLTPRQHANHKTRELAVLPGFDRRIDLCSDCGASKKVIRYRR